MANAAVMAAVDATGAATGVRAAVGGMEGAFPGARAAPASMARTAMAYAEGKTRETLDKKELAEKVSDSMFLAHACLKGLAQRYQPFLPFISHAFFFLSSESAY